VRGTTRQASRIAELDAAGVEPVLADPDRIATIAPAFDHVSVACVLLGSATGAPEALAALHGSRLEMLLARMLDTTVRGIVYEAAGSVTSDVLQGGAATVRRVCADSLIPYGLLETDPSEHDQWVQAALAAVHQVL